MKQLVAFVFCSVLLGVSAADLLENGVFESGTEDPLPGWSYNRAEINHQLDSLEMRNGRRTLKLLPRKKGFYFLTNAAGGTLDAFPDELILNGWVKTENVKGKSVFIGIWTSLKDGSNSLLFPAVELQDGSSGWTFFSKKITAKEICRRIETLPVDKRPFRWSYRINILQNPGTVWLSDLQLIDPAKEETHSIYLGRGAAKPEVLAARELSEYLGRVTGRKFPVRFTSAYRSGNPAVFLGREASKLAAGFQQKEPGEQEWIFKTVGNDLVITGGSPTGTLYGVYEFLEKYAQCAWYDFDTEVVPFNPDWKIPQLDERAGPGFLRREMYIGSPFDARTRLRNKENVRSECEETNINIGLPNGCHTFAWYSRDWKEADLFAMNRNGRRMGTQLCLTNPEVVRRIVKQLRMYIAADRKGKRPELWPRIYDISQDDGTGGECYCPECCKVLHEEGAYSGLNTRFINRIAQEIKKDYPEILIRTFAYAYTQLPPKKVVAADNVIIHSCNSAFFAPLLPETSNGKILEQWRLFAKNIAIWAYWKPYMGYEAPYVKSRSDMQTELRFCRDNGVIHYFAESEEPLQRSFFQFQYYIGMKLMQDPDRNLEKTVQQFMTAYYGAAAEKMLAYLNYLEQRQKEIPYGSSVTQLTYLDRAFYQTVHALLDQAEKLVKDDSRSLHHVRRERIPVDKSMLIRWEELAAGGPMPEKGAVIARYTANAKAAVSGAYGASWRRESVKKSLADIDNEAKLYKRLPAPIPEQFKGKKIVDLHWNKFNPYSDHIERCLIEDPEAVCGMAFHVSPEIDYKKLKRPALHFPPVTFGIYNYKTRKGGATVCLSAEKIPQDEKYHWYKVSRTTLVPGSVIWIHWSWMTQIYLNNAVTGIIPEDADVYISMKITGPAYVKGSRRRNDILVERAVFVKD